MDVDVVSGMYMLVRREAIDQVGVMNEDYFVYAEETDWCYRIKKAGWRCVFTPQARIIHLDGGSKSTDQASVKMYVQMQKSLLIFYKKRCGFPSWLAVKLIYVFFEIIRYTIFKIATLFKPDDLRLNKAAQSQAVLMFHLFGVEPR
jgi:GT2 family glycosyltransferase